MLSQLCELEFSSFLHFRVNRPNDSLSRLYLDQDERRIHVTSTKKKTNNPNFTETFCFQVSFLFKFEFIFSPSLSFFSI